MKKEKEKDMAGGEGGGRKRKIQEMAIRVKKGK